jgi:hypothetical protein
MASSSIKKAVFSCMTTQDYSFWTPEFHPPGPLKNVIWWHKFKDDKIIAEVKIWLRQTLRELLLTKNTHFCSQVEWNHRKWLRLCRKTVFVNNVFAHQSTEEIMQKNCVCK